MRLLAGWLSGLLCIGAVAPVEAARVRTWKETPESLVQGEAEGVAVSLQGSLFPAPRLSPLGPTSGDPELPGEPVHVWSLATDGAGNIFVGTGPDGRVLRVGPTGRREVLFEAAEPMVTALAVLPDSGLIAATAPGGRLYRVEPDGGGQLWSETGQRYVWSLAARSDGTVFAGTGESGAILQISDEGRTRVLFASEETHIVALRLAADGGLLAGGSGSGMLYRVEPDGTARVLYDDDLTQVVDFDVEPDGALLVALTDAPAPESKRPALRIQLPAGTQVGPVTDPVAGIDDESGTIVRGIIEGLPADAERGGARESGRLVRVRPGAASQTLWRSTRQAPFALARDALGRWIFGAGEPATLYRLDPGDELVLLASLTEAQVTGLIGAGRSTIAATSNPARLYRISGEAAEEGVFLSRPFDAGLPARWGSLDWETQSSGRRLEIYSRTGNSPRPDATWSAWSPARRGAELNEFAHLDGRYFQWRARFAGTEGDHRLSDVRVAYEPYNRPPTLREFYLDAPHNAVAGAATFRWSSYDPDQDTLEPVLEYRSKTTSTWQRAPGPNEDPTVQWDEERVTWQTDGLDEGDYVARLTLSDAPGNPPGEGQRVVGDQEVPFTVDRTPPAIELRRLDGDAYEIVVRDAHSPIERLELVSRGNVQHSLRPVDGLCDSPREVFRVDLAAGDRERGSAPWTARGVDSAGNKMEAALGER